MRSIILSVGLLFASMFTAQAQTTETQLITSLEEQGYTLVSRDKSWLQRIVFSFESATHTREVVLNPTNGLIMRDFEERRHENEEDGPWYLHMFDFSGPGDRDAESESSKEGEQQEENGNSESSSELGEQG